MSVINTNITSMIGQQNLNESKNALTTSMERLSSGLRINSAKDDAAGQAIANRMTAQITGLSQAQRNANDGISMAQTAEGSLNQINDNLQRIRELSVQAQNDTNSDDDLQSIQDEIGQRLSEIHRITDETDFNGTSVLNGAGSISIQVGANDGQAISIDLGQNGLTSQGGLLGDLFKTDPSDADNRLGNFVITKGDIETANVGSAPAAGDKLFSDDNVTFNVQADSSGTAQATSNAESGVYALKDGSGYVVRTDSNEFHAATVAQNGDVSFNSSTVAGGLPSGDVDIEGGKLTEGPRDFAFSALTGANGEIRTYSGGDGDPKYVMLDDSGAEDVYYEVSIDDSGLVSRGDVLTTENDTTDSPLQTLDTALKNVDSLRSELGAVQNRFESAITNLSTNETNLSAARSRIEDADYATEVANMTKNQILQQAGTSVLAQANQIPQGALSLLG